MKQLRHRAAQELAQGEGEWQRWKLTPGRWAPGALVFNSSAVRLSGDGETWGVRSGLQVVLSRPQEGTKPICKVDNNVFFKCLCFLLTKSVLCSFFQKHLLSSYYLYSNVLACQENKVNEAGFYPIGFPVSSGITHMSIWLSVPPSTSCGTSGKFPQRERRGIAAILQGCPEEYMC